MNKTLTVTIIISVLLIIGAFYGGIKYNQSSVAAARTSRQGQFAGGAGGIGGAGAFGGRGGLTVGNIISKDAQSITVQLLNNPANSANPSTQTGTVIVYLSASTTVVKVASTTTNALTVGNTVMVTGSKTSNGSVNANSIQIR